MKVPRLDLGLGEPHVERIAGVLRSGMLVQGRQVAELEDSLAARCERTHAVAVSSGTAALDLALEALEIGPGDAVLCPALTWPSPAHAVLRRGAELQLVDVDPQTWNATAEAFAAARTQNTKAAIVIDQFGAPADHDEIAAALPGVRIVEDAACALGSHYRGRPCGAFGAISCLSFHPLKVLTTGEGGMCLTDDPELARSLQTLRNHGQLEPGVFGRAGGNARLSELHAALGNAHLMDLDSRIERRRQIRARLVLEAPITVQHLPSESSTNVQTLGVVVDGVKDQADRDRVLRILRDQQIGAGPLSYALSKTGSIPDPVPCPNAEEIAARGLAVPCDAQISEVQVDALVAALRTAAQSF